MLEWLRSCKKLNRSTHWEWLQKLGVDQRPATDLLGAIGGQLKSKELFVDQPIHQAVASFGQGFSITPLKLAQLHALIANGGRLVTPHITKGFNGSVLPLNKKKYLKNLTINCYALKLLR